MTRREPEFNKPMVVIPLSPIGQGSKVLESWMCPMEPYEPSRRCENGSACGMLGGYVIIDGWKYVVCNEPEYSNWVRRRMEEQENGGSADDIGVRFVSREEAKARLLDRWDPAIRMAKVTGLPYRLPDWDSLRNYELEGYLEDNFEPYKWVIIEWCPYDGLFCTYRKYASKRDLKEFSVLVFDWEPVEGMPQLNKDMYYDIINKELARRPAELPELDVWVRGGEEKKDERDNRESVCGRDDRVARTSEAETGEGGGGAGTGSADSGVR